MFRYLPSCFAPDIVLRRKMCSFTALGLTEHEASGTKSLQDQHDTALIEGAGRAKCGAACRAYGVVLAAYGHRRCQRLRAAEGRGFLLRPTLRHFGT